MGNFSFLAADDERKGVLVTELPREDLLRSSRTLRRRAITVELRSDGQVMTRGVQQRPARTGRQDGR